MIVVYPIPPTLADNPYLDLLYQPMTGTEVEVRRVRPLRRGIAEALGRSGPRVVHLHFFDEICQRPSRAETMARTVAFVTLLRLLKGRGARLVWTVHNLEPHEVYQADLAEQLYGEVAALCDAVIAHSHSAATALAERYGRPPKLYVIPHGHYVGQHGPKVKRSIARAQLALPADAFVCVSLGAWRPYKGLEDLIAAFRDEERKACPEPAEGAEDRDRPSLFPRSRSLLLIAGQPKVPEYAAFLAQVASHVPGVRLLPGRVPDERMPTYWAVADVAAVPYRRLTSSGVLIEAMSYAVPVIAPDVPMVRELVRDGETGFLFQPGDVDSLRDALARAQAHPDLPAVGQAAFDHVRRYDWNTIAAQTICVYRDVVSAQMAGRVP